MKIGILLLVSYFFILNAVSCKKQLDSFKENACCLTFTDDCEINDQDLPEEDCTACNPLAACDCCTSVFPSVYAFNFSMACTYLLRKINYCEFIPSTTASPIWQPPKTL